ncbi:UDP-galactose:beta-D-galactoside beta-1,4-galactosyltransferase [Elysia marginata]|uniref:Glycosyltransferase family 92 protein n=1 Tax=Elysia marginata TaxID=1093978 RepID=A0AAV4EYC1_9GAST|nr:UDP-galactose:beta-D-galactoside beta-1,4-galactosyltransferase [Elysia marginata]
MFGTSPRFSVKASVKNIPEHHNLNYTAAYITCQIGKTQGYPAYVGLLQKKNLARTPSHVLAIEGEGVQRYGDGAWPGKESEVEFTVCIPSMFNNFDNAAQLVETLEMSRLLGAGRVVLYNTSIAPNVEAVLSMYIRQYQLGRDSLEVKVHPWQLPTFMENGVKKTFKEKEIIHYYGQLAAVDHCLNRYRQVSRYIVFSDLDEVIIPVHHATWSQLIAERQEKTTNGFLAYLLNIFRGKFAGFMFQSTLFNRDRPSPASGFETDALHYDSNILGYTSRDDYFFPPRRRSKLIVDPKKVDVMGTHRIWQGSGLTDNVPVHDGFVAHYRMPLYYCQSQVQDSSVAERFGVKLAERLKHVWSRLPGVALEWKHEKKNVHTKVCLEYNKGGLSDDQNLWIL